MSQDKATRLFISYYSLYIQYKERADLYRQTTGRDVQVYSDGIARLALSKANEYQAIAEGVR